MLADGVFGILEASLNGAATRQKVISHNISNINTPGFKKSVVSFEDQIQNIVSDPPKRLPLKTTSNKHISNIPTKIIPRIKKDYSPGIRADGNNVHLEQEMTKMAKNDLYFNSAVTQLNKRLAILKYAASDGRK